MTETYSYDADGERVSVTRAGITTYFFNGLWEETNGTVRRLYPFAGQVIAVREGATTSYLHGDQLGSVSVATSASGVVVSMQHYDPWGTVLAGGVPQARLSWHTACNSLSILLACMEAFSEPQIDEQVFRCGHVTGGCEEYDAHTGANSNIWVNLSIHSCTSGAHGYS